MFRVILCVQLYRLTQLIFFQHYLRALSAENANHLQTTDTLKRHRRYSIRYHCGCPSPGIWGSATHYGLPALPEPFLRARGLHRVCTRLEKIKIAEPFYDVQGDSMCSILSIDATCFSQHYLRALSAKNANHLQTTDTIKRHLRYSIRYHCG